MSYLIVILIILLITTPIAYLWIRGIDYMNKNYPDYKGEDFLNWEKETAPLETENGWDDNKNHTEGTI